MRALPSPAGAAFASSTRAAPPITDSFQVTTSTGSAPDEPVEIVTWKLSVAGGAPRVELAKAGPATGGDARKGTRPAYFPERGGYVDTPVYDRYALAAGRTIAGPAIVEERESTTVLPPGATATVDAYANLIVTLDGRP